MMVNIQVISVILLGLHYSLICPVLGDIQIQREGEDEFRKIDLPQDIQEVSCDQFFFGQPFPMPKINQTGLIKLCQTQQHIDYVGPTVFATLYSVTDKIPVYTASVSMLYPNDTGEERPDSHYWHRVSLEMCNLQKGNLPNYPISSRLGSMVNAREECSQYQATSYDYQGNWKLLGVDRGHLNPNSINSLDEETQVATFTLTNAAPQFSEFNQISWRQYECMTKYVIETHVPKERVYIVTGTWGVARDENNNPIWLNNGTGDGKNLVKVPGYYWKAVCFPGNPWDKVEPWSYVVMQENKKNRNDSTPDNFMSVKSFSQKYFTEDLFQTKCMEATSMGPIAEYFKMWEYHIHEKCPGYENKKEEKQIYDEL